MTSYLVLKCEFQKYQYVTFYIMMIAKYWHRFQRPKQYASWVLVTWPGKYGCDSWKPFRWIKHGQAAHPWKLCLNPIIQKDSRAVLRTRIRADRSSENSRQFQYEGRFVLQSAWINIQKVWFYLTETITT